jgi:hypothetical protein
MKTAGTFAICLIYCMSCTAGNSGVLQFVSNLYVNYGNNSAPTSCYAPRADTIYSERLLKLIRLDQDIAKGEVGLIEADPLCNCQDKKGLKVNKIEISNRGGIVYAKVKIDFQTGSTSVLLQLMKKGHKWLIDDVIDSTTTIPSLVEFLSKSLAVSKSDTTKSK